MRPLLLDLSQAVRALRRAPAFAATTILILGLGIGATLVLWSALDRLVLRPLAWSDGEGLVAVRDRVEGKPDNTTPPNYVAYRGAKALADLAATFEISAAISGGEGAPEQVPGVSATPNFFQVLGIVPLHGRAFLENEGGRGDPAAAIISHGLFERRFGGDVRLIGQTIRIEGASYPLVGVAPPGFDFPAGSEVWLAYRFSEGELQNTRFSHYLESFGRLADGASLETLQAELDVIAQRSAEAFKPSNEKVTAFAQPLVDWAAGDRRATVQLLFGAVALALLAACANLANLSLARAATRLREQALRLALGAAPGRVFAASLLESLVLAILGAGLGLVLAGATLRTLPQVFPDQPAFARLELDQFSIAVALGCAVLCSLLVGLAPALYSARQAPAAALRGGRTSTGSPKVARLRAALVITTGALAVVLAAGATLLSRSHARLAAVDPGFDVRQKLTFSMSLPNGTYGDPVRAAQLVERIREGIRALPGVDGVVATFGRPFSDLTFMLGLYSLDGRVLPSEENRQALVRPVSPDFFELHGIPVREGRSFTGADRHGSQRVAILNASAARKFFGSESVVGREVLVGASMGLGRGRLGGEVIGVVGDVRQLEIDQESPPTLYLPFDQAPIAFALTFVVAGQGKLDNHVEPIRRVIAGLDPELPIDRVRTYEQLVDASLQSRRLIARLLTGFALVALILSGLGLFGVLSQSVAERHRELAIRAALGATAAILLAAVARQALRLIGLGAVAGLALALLFGRVLENQLYQIEANDPLTLTLVCLGFVAIGLAIAVWPARHATRTDPAAALKSE